MKKLDKTNKKILQLLQENSAITNTELSNKIGLAPTSTLERVRKLEKNGIIKKYVALVDEKKVGIGIVVFVQVVMAEHNTESLQKFVTKIEKLPEVLECYRLAGEKDYLLKVVTEDIQSYDVFSKEKLGKISGIARMSSYFVLSPVKQMTDIPIK